MLPCTGAGLSTPERTPQLTLPRCVQVKEILVEESNVQPVNSPVTVGAPNPAHEVPQRPLHSYPPRSRGSAAFGLGTLGCRQWALCNGENTMQIVDPLRMDPAPVRACLSAGETRLNSKTWGAWCRVSRAVPGIRFAADILGHGTGRARTEACECMPLPCSDFHPHGGPDARHAYGRRCAATSMASFTTS